MCFNFISVFLTLIPFVSSSLAAPSCNTEPLISTLLNTENPKRPKLLPKTSSCKAADLKEIQKFQEVADQKINEVLSDKEFKDFVAEIQDKGVTPPGFPKDNSPSKGGSFVSKSFLSFTPLPDSSSLNPASCYVFVSLSMGKKALLHMAEEAQKWDAILVLRGFLDGSYKQTVHSLQKIVAKTGQGFVIDPELFSLFGITSVPTVVLSRSVPMLATNRVQTPIHDRLQGHVSLKYALGSFAKEGDLRFEAQALLKRGALE